MIVLEVPCFRESAVWRMLDSALQDATWQALCRAKPSDSDEVIHYRTYRLPFAYPVLEVGYQDNVKHLLDYFDQFENMYLIGRSSVFRYLHLHDLFKSGKEVIEQIVRV